jgi:hypothetical protein
MKMKNETNPEAVALAALNWTFGDDKRASRFIALTGMTPDDIRSRIKEADFLAASIRFLESYEPDLLLACAEALDLPPTMLIDARQALET